MQLYCEALCQCLRRLELSIPSALAIVTKNGSAQLVLWLGRKARCRDPRIKPTRQQRDTDHAIN